MTFKLDKTLTLLKTCQICLYPEIAVSNMIFFFFLQKLSIINGFDVLTMFRVQIFFFFCVCVRDTKNSHLLSECSRSNQVKISRTRLVKLSTPIIAQHGNTGARTLLAYTFPFHMRTTIHPPTLSFQICTKLHQQDPYFTAPRYRGALQRGTRWGTQ